MPDVTSKRDGSWVVELIVPLHHNGADISQLVIRPATMEHVARWADKDNPIPSIMALMAELTNIPERVLKLIQYPDADRLQNVFAVMLPPLIRDHPREMFTPEDQLPPADIDGMAMPVDQQDPHFPHSPEPVKKRFTEPPKFNIPDRLKPKVDEPKSDTTGMGMDAGIPEGMRPVGQS
jgi:hypothetical protein